MAQPLLVSRCKAFVWLFFALLMALSTGATAQRWDFAEAVGTAPFNGLAEGYKTTTDAAGNVYLLGSLAGTVDLGGRTLTGTSRPGYYGYFIAKLSATGQYLWAVQMGETQLNDLAVDGAGNLYVTGNFRSATLTLGGTTLTNTSAQGYSTDAFVGKLNPSGQWLWAAGVSGAGSESGTALGLDAAGNAYVAGEFSGDAEFGPVVLTGTSQHLFVAQVSAAGQWLTATKAGSDEITHAASLAVDGSGNVFLTGTFRGASAIFGTTTLSSAGPFSDDIFIAKLTAAGQWQWAVKAGGNQSDTSSKLALDAAGNVYVTGRFLSTTATFGPTSFLNTSVTSPTYSYDPTDLFVSKLSTSGQWQWSVKAIGDRRDSSDGLAVDAAGNVYITGSFDSSTLSFPNSSITLTKVGYGAAYVAMLNTNGQWQWATQSGGYGVANSMSLALSAGNSLYILGRFYEGNVSLGSTMLTNSGKSNLLLARLSTTGQWESAGQSNGGGSSSILSTAVDTGGNVYVAGSFTGTIAFGTISLTSANRTELFVAKRSAAGQWQWAVRATGRADFSPGYFDDKQTLAVDGSGNVYLTGNFSGPSATFGPSTLSSTSGGYLGYDVFVAKLNSSGQWQWAAKGGSTDDDYANSLAIDGSGNVYLTGLFQGPSASFGSYTLANSGPVQSGEAFVAKISGAGQWLWATAGGSTSSDYGTGVALDNASNAYVTGSFAGPSATFGSYTVYSPSSTSTFVAKISAAGQWQWVTASNGGSANSIAVDGTGSSYITGGFRGFSTFGSVSLSSSDTADVFVAKLDPTGQWQWATMGGTRGANYSDDIAVDGNGSAYVSGGFRSAGAVFGSTTLPYSHSGYYDTFVARLTPAGQWQWAASAGGSAFNGSLALDGSGGAYVVGSFGGSQGASSATFGPLRVSGSGPVHTTGFLAHISSLPTAAIPARAQLLAQAFPNPFSQGLMVQLYRPASGPVELTARDVTGQLRLRKTVAAGSQSLLTVPEAAQWPAGLYLLTIRQGQQEQVLKVVRQ